MDAAVQRAVSLIWTRYVEPVTLNELAGSVFLSPFHFLRVFARATGVTPGRYLSAVRMFEAKRLLLTTSMTVSDIVCRVGYTSVGTFTSRFTRTVGMTPSQYRDPAVGALVIAVGPGFCRMPSVHIVPPPAVTAPALTAKLDWPGDAPPANVFIGVFEEAIPERAPVAYRQVAHPELDKISIPHVPPGRWTVLAVAESPLGGSPLLIAHCPSVSVSAGRPTRVRLRLRAPAPTDPPLAIALASRRLPVPAGSAASGQDQRPQNRPSEDQPPQTVPWVPLPVAA